MLTKSSELLLSRDNISSFTVEFSEDTEVALTASELDVYGALGGVVGGVIGKAVVGVLLIIYEGMEVASKASELDDDGALGDLVVDVIGIHDGS